MQRPSWGSASWFNGEYVAAATTYRHVRTERYSAWLLEGTDHIEYTANKQPLLKGNSVLSEDFESFIRGHNAMAEREMTRDFLTHVDSWFLIDGSHPHVFANQMEPVLNG